MAPKGQIVYSFRILREGWELDCKGWVVQQPNGRLKLVTTDHGHECEMRVSELRELISGHEEVLEELKTALSYMEDQ